MAAAFGTALDDGALVDDAVLRGGGGDEAGGNPGQRNQTGGDGEQFHLTLLMSLKNSAQ